MRKLKEKIFAIFLICIMMTEDVFAAEAIEIYPSEDGKKIYTVTGDESKLPDLLSHSAIVVDMKTGYTLVEKNIKDKLYPASITKIMTAILAIENSNKSDVVTFSHDAVFSIEKGSSAALVDMGEELTVEQCLYGLMLISGNDLANGLAEHVAGSMDEFANMMTNKAKEIGCLNTNFKNAHGLHDDNHYTTAYDMALIAKYAYENAEKLDANNNIEMSFRTFCSTGYYECQPTNKQPQVRQWRNNNRLINPYEPQYYEGCIGGKTGYTNKAGGTLVTFANINGRIVLCVVMKSANSLSAYADTRNLYDYIKENINPDIYSKLDDDFAKTHQATEEQNTGTNATVKPSENEPNNSSSSSSSSDDGMWIGWKILILAVTVFIIYYIYIQYMRYQKRKKRQEMRRRRRMEEQRQYRR